MSCVCSNARHSASGLLEGSLEVFDRKPSFSGMERIAGIEIDKYLHKTARLQILGRSKPI